MTIRTRYFVIASLLTTTVGLGAGLVAYYGGLQGIDASPDGPAELAFIPSDATLVAFADVQSVMASEVQQQFRRMLPAGGDGHQEFEAATGIDIERDLDYVVAYLAPPTAEDQSLPASGLALARGRFDTARIEALMREQGATVENHGGTQIIVAPAGNRPGLALAFVEPGLAAVGSARLVRTALDLRSGGANVTANAELMDLVRTVDGDVWAVGRFDALTEQANLPAAVVERLPAITQFAASGQVNGGIRGVLQAQARDEQAATELRDLVRGILALARMQAPSRPEVQALLDSFELGGTGNTIAFSFAVAPELIEWLHQTSTGAGGQSAR